MVRQPEFDFGSARKLKVNSFFSGIGGFDIGFENAGFEISFLCEINPYCNQVLQSHWPDTPKATDITKIHLDKLPQADVWCGGFPCQDISVARGTSRPGLTGARSGLFYQYADLIEANKPNVVVIENVAGLFNSNSGRDFGVILQRMTGMGYAVAWRLLNSRYFGVPQSRNRIYFCCWRNSPVKAVNALFESSEYRPSKKDRTEFLTSSTPKGKFPVVPVTAFCLAATSGRHTGTDWSRTYVVCEDGVRRMTPLEYERLQGFPDMWTLPFGAENTEEMDTLRYVALGNAVSVPVVEWIAGRIRREWNATNISNALEIPNRKNGAWDSVDLAQANFSDDTARVWPRAGLAWNNRIMGSDLYPGPGVPVSSTVYSIVERRFVGKKYYLTSNAAEGILRRVDNQGRTLFPLLREALEQEVKKK